MRWRGVNHVEFSVINYDESIKFYDRMFGWLGVCKSVDAGRRTPVHLLSSPSSGAA